jgi:hypothetical protein
LPTAEANQRNVYPRITKTRTGKQNVEPNIAGIIAMLPTPNSNSATGPGNHGEGGKDLKTQIGTRPGLKLHPDFALWMMGYPLKWLDVPFETRTGRKDLKQSGIQSSRKSHTKSLRQSQKLKMKKTRKPLDNRRGKSKKRLDK